VKRDFATGAASGEVTVPGLPLAELEFVLGQLPQSAWLLGADGRVLFANEAASLAFGWTREEWVRLTLGELDADAQALGWAEAWQRVRSGVALPIERRLRSKEGRMITADIRLSRFTFGASDHCMALASHLSSDEDAAERRSPLWRGLMRAIGQAPDAIVRHDLSLRRIYANRAFSRLTGLTPAQALGSTPGDAPLAGMDHEAMVGALCAARDTGMPQELEFPLATQGGATVWLHCRVVLECDDEGRPASLLTVAHDVTKRRQVQEQLNQRVREFRTLAENSPDNIARYDRQCRLVYANPAVAAAWGVDVQQLRGQRPSETAPSERHWLHRCEQLMRQVLQAGTAAEAEMAGTQADGQRHTYHVRIVPERDAAGEVCGVLVLGRDISERKRAEEAQLQRKQEFRALVDNSPDLVARHDRSGRRLYANPALSRLLARDEDGQPRLDDWSFTHEATRFRAWLDEVVGQRRTRLGELRYRRADGELGWLDLRLCPEFGEDGEVATVLAIARDVTDLVVRRETLEAEVLRRTADLEAASQRANAANQAKSDFLAVMSHEIRTPLNGMLGMTELLATTRLDEHQRRLIEAARMSGRHLLALLNDVLDLARIEANEVRLEAERVDVRHLADEAASPFVGTAVSRGLRLEVKVDEDVPADAHCDPLRLRQVLVNLLGNAVKFTHAGGVELRISRAALIDPDDDVPQLRFEVVDTGIGITPEALPHIFDAFTQADNSTARHYGGSGLGLAICARLVCMMGGHLRADSEPGRGSRFHFTLPVGSALRVTDFGRLEPVATAGPDAAEAPAAWRLPSVLVVEDSEINLEVARSMLGYHGVTPHTASDGHEALRMVEDSAYDLIFMDCMMPGIDGYETVRRIRRLEAALGRERPASIVALTANVGDSDVRQCLDAGMDDFLAKPVSLQTIGRALDAWTQNRK
jgi:PAS domain S-box-containing protein